MDATVRRPADAEKYRLEKLAEAKKQHVILHAEADAEAERVSVEYIGGVHVYVFCTSTHQLKLTTHSKTFSQVVTAIIAIAAQTFSISHHIAQVRET